MLANSLAFLWVVTLKLFISIVFNVVVRFVACLMMNFNLNDIRARLDFLRCWAKCAACLQETGDMPLAIEAYGYAITSWETVCLIKLHWIFCFITRIFNECIFYAFLGGYLITW
jgi:hypothetical protein